MTVMPKKKELSPDPMTEALTPVADALNAAQRNFVMSEATRDFVKRSAEQAKETAETIRNGADKITTSLETAAAEAVGGAAALSRNLQQAVYQDVEGFLAAVEKVASAASMKEAAQLHVVFLR